MRFCDFFLLQAFTVGEQCRYKPNEPFNPGAMPTGTGQLKIVAHQSGGPQWDHEFRVGSAAVTSGIRLVFVTYYEYHVVIVEKPNTTYVNLNLGEQPPYFIRYGKSLLLQSNVINNMLHIDPMILELVKYSATFKYFETYNV